MFRVQFISTVSREGRPIQAASITETVSAPSILSLKEEILKSCLLRKSTIAHIVEDGAGWEVRPIVKFDTLECVRKGDPGEIDVLMDSFEEIT